MLFKIRCNFFFFFKLKKEKVTFFDKPKLLQMDKDWLKPIPNIWVKLYSKE